MNPKLTQLYFISLFAILISCTKTEIIPPLEVQKQLLSGTGSYQNTQHTWQLDSTKIDGASITLTPSQKSYKKTFRFDGGYSDSDNNMGIWEIATLNKLKQTVIYQLTGKQDSIVFDIISINAAQLNLSLKTSNGKTVFYHLKIVN
jgi:hypothetical protein